MTDVPDASSLTFVSASALVSVLDRTAQGHPMAGALWRLEFDAGATLVTTDLALVKASMELQRRFGLSGLRDLLEVTRPALRVEFCAQTDLGLAIATLLTSTDDSQDLVDHVDVQVKRRLRITTDLGG